jgi:hypothetical protein
MGETPISIGRDSSMWIFRKPIRILISLLFCSRLILASDAVPQKFLLISDIDSTLKITNTLTYYDLVCDGLWGRFTFPGMAELFQNLNPHAQSIIYLSVAPQTLIPSTRNLLVNENGFPEGNFIFRNWLWWESAFHFKTSQLVHLSQTTTAPLLLFGDDTQEDPEILSQFAETLPPERTLQIYIHQVTGRALPKGVTSFLTAFDVAIHEMELGRLSADQVIQVGTALLEDKKLNLLFPPFKKCPKEIPAREIRAPEKLDVLNILSEQIRIKIQTYCNQNSERLILTQKKILEQKPMRIGANNELTAD